MKSKLTLKPYTKREMEELKSIQVLPRGQKFQAINRFAKAFNRTPLAVQQKLYTLNKSTKTSIKKTVMEPANDITGEISLKIKSLRIEGNKLFIKI